MIKKSEYIWRMIMMNNHEGIKILCMYMWSVCPVCLVSSVCFSIFLVWSMCPIVLLQTVYARCVCWVLCVVCAWRLFSVPINFCVSCNSMLGVFRVSVRLFCDPCVPYACRQFSVSCQFLCNLMSSVCLSSCVYIPTLLWSWSRACHLINKPMVGFILKRTIWGEK